MFQILLDDERRPIIFTTPTTLAGGIAIAPPVLAEGTQNSRDSVTNQGQTSCTKRTKLSFVATTLGGALLNVSAVLLRHGEASACYIPIPFMLFSGNALLVMYKIFPYASPPSASSSPVQIRYKPPPGPPTHYRPSEYRRISSASDGYPHPSSVPQPGLPGVMHQPPYNATYSPESSSHHPGGSSYESGYPPTSPDDGHSLVSSPRSPLSARSHHRGISMRRNSLNDQATMSTTGQGSLSPLGSLEENKAMMHDPRQGIHSPTEPSYIIERTHGSSSSMTDNDLPVNNLRGRPAKEPPKGVTCCRSCHTTVTPEWRKGPTGNKDMCNACGLRWNRRVKKMKGEGTNLSDSSFNGFAMASPEAEALLEPQRAGGGSKKGHRKKMVESRGPALTTRPPAKRRYSDASGMSGDALSTSPNDDPRADMPHDSFGGPHQTHPHNPHHSHSASSSSRPSLAPLFDDSSSNFSPVSHMPSNLQPQTPLTASSVNTSHSGTGRMDYHQQRTPVNHQMKSPSTPEVMHGYFSPSSQPPADRKPFDPVYPRPPGSPPSNGNQYMNVEHPHRNIPPGERPSLEMPEIHQYNQNPDSRHGHAPPSHFDRRPTDPNLSNGASHHPPSAR